MNQIKDRLLSLITFAQESAKLKLSPSWHVKKHPFCQFEHELQGLPGIHFNSGGEESEIWLAIDRLHETTAPLPTNPSLAPWVEVSNNPAKKPELRSTLEFKQTQGESQTELYCDSLPINEPKLLLLEEFKDRIEIKSKFKAYLVSQWSPWAAEEKKRRQTIRIYSQLFTIKQQLEGDILDSQMELSWGVGICTWNMNDVKICLPLITQAVELRLNNKTMALEIGPRDVEDYLELDLFVSADNPGTADLEKTYKDFIAHRAQGLSPFDRGSFESILRAGARFLDSKGLYWPEQTSADDRTVPAASENLKVTDTWVLMARPRGKSFFVQDLERFKKELTEDPSTDLPKAAVDAVLKEPASVSQNVIIPSFRGVSTLFGDKRSNDDCKQETNELYFPLPFNNEQARIVQLLEAYDGVVVQGPPGTGKTHTIANIISHYLALGKRILVTSMKEPALAVLRDKLPLELQPFAISLLTNEQEGMKQFEASIGKIASELQSISKSTLKKEITVLDETIENLHSRLARVDRQIRDWSKQNLSAILLDGDSITSVMAATELVKFQGQYEWLEDKLSLDSHASFNTSDLARLREARGIIAGKLGYLGIPLPEMALLPKQNDILYLHQRLSRLAELERSIKAGDLPPLSSSTSDAIQKTYFLVEMIKNYIHLTRKIQLSDAQWKESARTLLATKTTSLKPLLDIFDTIGKDLKEAEESRHSFIARPVYTPSNIELDNDFLKAVENMANNKRAFGLIGWLRNGALKKKLETVKILEHSPGNEEDWQHIHFYLQLRLRYRELLSRWNSVAGELSVECLENIEPTCVLKAVESFRLHEMLREQLSIENKIVAQSKELLSSWNESLGLPEKLESLTRLQKILERHILRFELSVENSNKEQLQERLSNYKGPVIEKFRDLILTSLGNSEISNEHMLKQWSLLLDELKHLHGLRTAFADIKEICSLIETSGAMKWAQQLRTIPVKGAVDRLLPNNWKAAWRLRKLTTYLDKIDCRQELKKLAIQRKETEIVLAKTYQDVIEKRTWLKLSERATPNIRSALEAFRTAIAKIGKGTGKRSVRYRQDARRAATSANHAIPCWIMPHWRVSESLPSKIGAFDLVIIDEASQSDLSALPALLRAQKVLVVGDEKQVSPEGVGLEEEKIRNLMTRHLNNQVELFRAQMTPDRSIYDLFKVVFPESSLMLKEHFRCVSPIIEYSKREHYNHELKPIRLPKASERLDPPLVDIIVEDGCRRSNSDVNLAEARVIIDEIKKINSDPKLSHRTIGIVSLLGARQAMKIWEMLENELGPEAIKQHSIACGDARTFQGKERDIVFLSMVVSPGNAHAQTRDSIAQRFNVAASRAKDRMYLVRSVELEDLSQKDLLRRQLIAHFSQPFTKDEERIEDLREKCESDFELEVYDLLTERGYRVTPQVKAGEYRIDMVAEGHNDALLAIECDGDRFHGPDRWEDDMHRQRILERVGWRFWRCFASDFVRNRREVVDDLLNALNERGISPIGKDGAINSFHTEQRRIVAFKTSNPINELEEASEHVEQNGTLIPDKMDLIHNHGSK